MMTVDITDSNMRYRLGHFISVTFLVCMTAMVRGTCLWTPGNRITSVILVIAMYALSISSFLLVQGSDPGYIESESEFSDIEESLEYPHDTTDGAFYGSNPSILKNVQNNQEYQENQGNQENQENCEEDKLLSEPSDVRNNLISMSHNYPRNYRPGEPSGLLTTPNRRRNDREGKGKEGKGKGKKSRTRCCGRGSAGAVTMRKGDSNIDGDGIDNDENAETNRYECFCKYCDMSVPLRSHHCNFCQKCVATFDHHCFVIGTCIGERNHCRFYTCISLNFFGVWCLSFIVNSAFKNIPESGSSSVPYSGIYTVFDYQTAYIISLFIGIIWWYLFILVSYQTWLVITSSTGYECIKSNNAPTSPNRDDDYDTCDSPYRGKHFGESFFSFCCVRDGFFSALKGVPWIPMNWKKAPSKPDLETVTIWDNFCRNKYYSCC